MTENCGGIPVVCFIFYSWVRIFLTNRKRLVHSLELGGMRPSNVGKNVESFDTRPPLSVDQPHCLNFPKIKRTETGGK